ncbi:unnamed protein product [Ranitomeya imitator]|uniref:Uncharacterized protein n=1 Tax=Ranitomeya imitator TaxID=111125 RepID=A0ABN9LBZ3_9NEOB|nr:unnamed protein product [Ranitomeya imitator]
MAEKFGPVYTLYLGSRPTVVLTGYQAVKEALVESGDAFTNRGASPLLDRIFHNGGQPVDPNKTLMFASSNVIANLVFGSRKCYDDERWQKILQDTHDAFHLISSIWGQLYDIFPGIMYYLPGPHKKIFSLLKSLEDAVEESVRSHQKTLDPACPRDFIDCFLLRMKQVS